MPAKRKPSKFIAAHALTYGIKVTSRDPQNKEPTAVICMFCSVYGREEDVSVGRKRARTAKPKFWNGPSFRSDYFKAHMEQQHSEKWKDYQELSPEAKKKFFDLPKTTPKNNGSQMSMFAFAEARQHKLTYLLDRDIVEVVIGDMLFHPDDIHGITHSRAMAPFINMLDEDTEVAGESSSGVSQYKIVINNPLQYRIVVGHLSTFCEEHGTHAGVLAADLMFGDRRGLDVQAVLSCPAVHEGVHRYGRHGMRPGL
jgi:hypothetical protein